MACNSVLNVEVPLCAETLIVSTDLSSGVYKSVITDKFGQKYEREVTVYGSTFQVDLTDYPQGLISEYGILLFELFNGCDLQILTDCETEYSQLVLHFIPNDTTETEIEICCS